MPALSGRWRPGTLADWDDARGFGFIAPDEGGRRVFVHVSAFPGGRRPTVGSPVTFVAGVDGRGRPQARGARLVGARPRSRRPGRRGVGPTLVVAALALGGLVALGLLEPSLVWVGAASAALSLVAFATYAVDKRAALRGGQRVPESTLHLLALLGGWPGALVAQRVLRHKTIKQPFRTVFATTVGVHVLAVVGLVLLVTAGAPG